MPVKEKSSSPSFLSFLLLDPAEFQQGGKSQGKRLMTFTGTDATWPQASPVSWRLSMTFVDIMPSNIDSMALAGEGHMLALTSLEEYRSTL